MERHLTPDHDHVIYFDEHRRAHHALVTVWWNSNKATLKEFREFCQDPNAMPCCNIVYVVKEADRRDQYGQQTKHEGSVVHGSKQTPPNLGRYFLWPDERVI